MVTIVAPMGRAAQSRPHPRSYGTFARVLGYCCRERRLFELPEAVRVSGTGVMFLSPEWRREAESGNLALSLPRSPRLRPTVVASAAKTTPALFREWPWEWSYALAEAP